MITPFSQDHSKNLSVVVDGKNIALRQGTGVASYARSLCNNLAAMNVVVDLLYGEDVLSNSATLGEELAYSDAYSRRRKRPYIIRYFERMLRVQREAVPDPLRFDFSRMTEQHRARLPRASRYWNAPHAFDPPPILVERGQFQSIRNVMAADIAHWTYPVPSHLNDAANIYTLHDLVPLKLPETTLDNKRAYYAMIQRITQNADLIVTVSEQSKADIHELFDVPDGRVVTTYQDVNVPADLLVPDIDTVAESVKMDFGLNIGQFFLFYGAIEPKKNIGRLIEAYLATELDIPLILVGKDGWLMEEELRLYRQHIRRMDGPVRIIRIPYVTHPQLINLIRAACAVTFPSIYEGFGLPLVEAMVCGTPLLTSNFGAMREVAGNAALLVDPYDVRSIADGLRALFEEPTMRDDLIAAGRVRAEKFSSTAYQQRLRAAYAEIRR